MTTVRCLETSSGLKQLLIALRCQGRRVNQVITSVIACRRPRRQAGRGCSSGQGIAVSWRSCSGRKFLQAQTSKRGWPFKDVSCEVRTGRCCEMGEGPSYFEMDIRLGPEAWAGLQDRCQGEPKSASRKRLRFCSQALRRRFRYAKTQLVTETTPPRTLEL